MGTREDLEAALAVAFDHQTLEVYADYLQAIGDPRGELIALDLGIEGRPCPPELAARRTQLLHAWLGALVPADNVHRSWVGDSLRLGFIDDLELDDADPNAQPRLDALLASDAGRYLRGVTLRGRAAGVAVLLARLSATRHGWMRRLTLACQSPGEPLDAATTDAVIAAMPHLEVLEVTGERVLGAFAHPHLRRLVLTGIRAIVSEADSPAFASVTELDLAFASPRPQYYDYDYEYGEPDADEPPLEGLRVLAARLPALRRLDLSRNDPETPTGFNAGAYSDEDMLTAEVDANPGAPLSAIAYLAGLPQRRSLTHVRLPSIRSDAEVAELEAALAGMSALVELEIVHGHYFEIPELAHPTARLVRPPAWPWPRPTSIAAAATVSIIAPGARSGDTVALDDAIRVLEQRFETLPIAAREAWTAFWHAVAELAGDEPRTLPAVALVRALEACPIETGGWRQLNDELRSRRPFPVDAVVRLGRD